jgi:hypothetical protein
MAQFGSSRDFIEFHDEVAMLGKWAFSDRIYLGAQSGSIVELSCAPNTPGKFYTTRNVHTHCP